ncbi:hypothetical protein BURMUCGD1_3900 [Burkholderia multivorans CGD1]|nr:hypothetical protein BURMUCGD1_3900 [Burkholderia multivorans CGD1]
MRFPGAGLKQFICPPDRCDLHEPQPFAASQPLSVVEAASVPACPSCVVT